MDYIIHYCENLRLIPNDITKKLLEKKAKRILEGDNNPDLVIDFIQEAKNAGMFTPYCSRNEEFCIVTESPLVSIQNHNLQSLSKTVDNSKRMKYCKDRKVEEKDESKCLDPFLLGQMLAVFEE